MEFSTIVIAYRLTFSVIGCSSSLSKAAAKQSLVCVAKSSQTPVGNGRGEYGEWIQSRLGGGVLFFPFFPVILGEIAVIGVFGWPLRPAISVPLQPQRAHALLVTITLFVAHREMAITPITASFCSPAPVLTITIIICVILN